MDQLVCPKCGQAIQAPPCPHCADKVVFRIVQRELVLLIVLCAVAVLLFVFTRSMAARNRALNVDVAVTWYRLGQDQLKAGNTEGAIDSFRRAATSDHDNPDYALALARALAAANHAEEARQSLLRLRVSAPENSEINLSLARLVAIEGMTAEAVRYYRNALYGVWPADQIAERRTKVRTELVGLLLSIGDMSQALSELLILSSDVPDTEQAHLDLGRLFLDAGDSQHALDQFSRALRLNPKSGMALAGVGHSSFNLGDYAKARRFLEAAMENGNGFEATAGLLEIAKLVISKDPLAPRLVTTERIRRLIENLNIAFGELQSCLGKGPVDRSSLAILEPLIAEAETGLKADFTPSKLRADADGFRTGLNLIYRMEAATNDVCRESSSFQRAMLLIARKYGIAEQ